MNSGRLRAGLMLVFAAALVWFVAPAFRTQRAPEVLWPSRGLARTRHLSEYNPLLAGTPGDTEVFEFIGSQPGGTLLVLGGTHATEIAGVVTAALLVETLAVRAGRVLVIPRANQSAATHTEPGEAHPAFVTVNLPNGPRRFRYGARYTNPIHQERDPEVYRHPASPRILQGCEARNLNRVYPGVQNGTLTQKVAWAIVEMIRSEAVDIAFDLHEAPPDRDLVNAIVAPERSQEIAAEATILLQLAGWDFHLESSPTMFRGLSHREWADTTQTLPFLMETANPLQGRLHGRSSASLAVTGRDKGYERAAAQGLLALKYDGDGVPIGQRVARNLAGLGTILEVYNATTASRRILIDELGKGWCQNPPGGAAVCGPIGVKKCHPGQ